MLARFPAEDRADMVEDGEIKVTCEFCSTTYRVSPANARHASEFARPRVVFSP